MPSTSPQPAPAETGHTPPSAQEGNTAHGRERRSSHERRRSRSRSRSSERRHRSSSRRHRPRRSRSSSRSRTPSRSRSRSPKSSRRRDRRHRHSRSRSRSRSASSRSRSRSHERRQRHRRRTRSRSRSHSQRRRSRSRERRERNQNLLPAADAAPMPTEPRRPLVVTRDQRDPQYGGRGGAHFSRNNNDPLSQRPPPPPSERPASLLSHVLPSSRGKFAYVWLVMKGDSYACGAIISAYSLKLAGTRHSLVCMVTSDVSEECRRRMRHVFHEVVEVPYLQYEVKPLRTQKQRSMYNSWVDAAFTKWNMLSLTQYEKALFVDADKICLSNLDHLFEELHTPAGTFSSPWSQPFVERKDHIASRKGIASNRARYSNARGMPNPYQQCGQDSRVTSSMVHSALTEQSFVVIGTVVLLSPNLEDFEQYKAMLGALVPFGFSDCHSMMDEQSLSYYFAIHKNKLIRQGLYGRLTEGGKDTADAAAAAPSAMQAAASASSSSSSSSSSSLPAGAYSEWSYIHHMYNYVPWHRYWLAGEEVPFTFHFFNVKPWVSDRNAWLDLEAWWELVAALLTDEALTAHQRDDLRAIYPAPMLALPKNDGCAWCRLSEESFLAPADGSWKNHNVFDARGHLQCPAIKAGFEHFAQKRLAAPNRPTESRLAESTK